MSKQITQRFIEYWRRSIVERALGKGTFSDDDLKKFSEHQKVCDSVWDSGQLIGEIVEQFFADVDDAIPEIELSLWPYLYLLEAESGESTRALPPAVAPLAVQVKLDRDGFLHPTRKVAIPRSLLAPIPRGSVSIGELDDFDSFVTRYPVARFDASSPEEERSREEIWLDFCGYCDKLLAAVAGSWLENPGRYEKAGYGYAIDEADASSASKVIVSLLDYLRETGVPNRLLGRITQLENNSALVNPPQTAETFTARSGHFTSAYPLSPSQRNGLSAALVAGDGEAVALNGPPGTGKTTLLLSVVASTMVSRALAGSEPALMVACSTNNQAITNILDAFASGFEHDDTPFGRRWLPNVESYGSFFPAKSKQERADKDGYQTKTFFDRVEDPRYVAKATTELLTKAAEAFGNDSSQSLSGAVAALRDELGRNEQLLGSVASLYQNWEASSKELQQLLSDVSTEDTFERTREHAARWAQVESAWGQYRASEPVLYGLFSWLSPVRKKRDLRAAAFLRELLPDFQLDVADHDATSSWIGSVTAAVQRHYSACEAVLGVVSTLNSLGADFRGDVVPTLAELDDACDVTVRFRQFQLAARYWEARWLEEITKDLPYLAERRNKRGRSTIAPRWRRRMMLTPCSVMTFYKAPENFRVRVPGSGRDEFLDDYMFDEIDLLIVDEAGQVSPDIAGATFALAKKALVVGDCRQLQPIAGTAAELDFRTTLETGLASSLDDYEDMDSLGVTVASGSIMKHAQMAGRYHQVPVLDRGLYLFEHRRCFNEIIGFCNELSYQGALQPRRGAAPKDPVVPTLGLAHVDGICETNSARSRYNRLEVTAIVNWVISNQAILEDRYNLPLEEIVAVVTPFSAQTSLIKKRLLDAGIDASKKLTVGTVHSLQGAERPVVIFSQVYSVHADGGFIDQDNTMLNVAVSRAKDSFLVFGDLHAMSGASDSTPRRQLYKWMAGHNAVELDYGDLPARSDLTDARRHPLVEVFQLDEFADHDQFLRSVLAGSHNEVHIVSPFVRHDAMQSSGAYQLMAEAVESGVSVDVYSDREFTDRLTGGLLTDHFETVAHHLTKSNVAFHEVRSVHSKLVVADRSVYCVGSFNWFSASRDSERANQETSLVYRGGSLIDEIDARLADLSKRTIG